MAKISSQLKFFARKSSGELHPVPLLNVINMAVELVKPQLKSNQVSISLDDGNIDVQVNVDQVQLEQVLVNLLSNAMQAVEDASDKHIHITLCREQEHVIVQVDDSGTGINATNLPQLFDPFFTTKETGLGLGLSISHKIMRSMHGNIKAENRPHSGARFSLTLPIATELT
jgi:two-component system C4-dicarboxylate transport sensor histidine kinase DctB